MIVFWGAYWSFGNCDETMFLTVKKIKLSKILGLNVKLKDDKSKFLPIMTVKWEEKVLNWVKYEVQHSWYAPLLLRAPNPQLQTCSRHHLKITTCIFKFILISDFLTQGSVVSLLGFGLLGLGNGVLEVCIVMWFLRICLRMLPFSSSFIPKKNNRKPHAPKPRTPKAINANFQYSK